MFCVRIEVVGSLWWLMRDIGLGFGPLPGQGPRALEPRPEGPWGWLLVLGVRIEVVGSPFFIRVRVRIGLGLG